MEEKDSYYYLTPTQQVARLRAYLEAGDREGHNADIKAANDVDFMSRTSFFSLCCDGIDFTAYNSLEGWDLRQADLRNAIVTEECLQGVKCNAARGLPASMEPKPAVASPMPPSYIDMDSDEARGVFFVSLLGRSDLVEAAQVHERSLANSSSGYSRGCYYQLILPSSVNLTGKGTALAAFPLGDVDLSQTRGSQADFQAAAARGAKVPAWVRMPQPA